MTEPEIEIKTVASGPRDKDRSGKIIASSMRSDPECNLCHGDIITHTPLARVIGKSSHIGKYLMAAKESNLLFDIIERIKGSGSQSKLSLTERVGASMPRCKKEGVQLPIRSSIVTVRTSESGEIRESIPEPGSRLFDLSRSIPIGGTKRGRSDMIRTEPMTLLDRLRVTHRGDLRDIISAYPAITYQDIGRRIPRRLRKDNLLLPWMIDRLNRDRSIASSMAHLTRTSLATPAMALSTSPFTNLLDIVFVYEKYCRNRDLPSREKIERASCIGMSIAMDHRTRLPAFVSLFIWPYGQWLFHVDPYADRDQISRALLLDTLSNAAIAHIPIIHAEKNIACVIGKMCNSISDDFSLPSFVQIGGEDVTSASEKIGMSDVDVDVEKMAWKYLGIDMVSWHVYKDIARLEEYPPKNPISASYLCEWKLRWEQMAKLASESLACVCIFENFVRVIAASQSTK